MAKVYYEP
jgi:hypothetical protein